MRVATISVFNGLHNFKKKHNPNNAKMMAKSDMIETVRICESLKNKSLDSYSMPFPILIEFIGTVKKVFDYVLKLDCNFYVPS